MMQEMIDMVDPFSSTNLKPMITIRNAYKSYGKNNAVLKGLCMTVQPGTIYGLLGPSGCGKTTLLCCITGQLELDQGSVKVNIKRRKQLGYMPQFISLFEKMSVMENFLIFGYIMGLSKDEIERESRNLISFLELPSADRIVEDMSGGQQRRMSMAVSFLHNPAVLIMDEPTVGLDPILCQSIWGKLLELAAEGKCIVITTHYIQEAQRADKVGLMRNGRLLVEENPQILMDRFGCTNLEDVFYRAITEQERNPVQTNRSDMQGVVEDTHNFRSTKVHYEDVDKIVSIKRLKGLIYKNLVLIRREALIFLFLISFPVFQCTLYNTVVGEKPRDLPIAIINEEISLDDCHLYDLEGICLLDNINEKYFSCRFVDELRNYFKVLEYSNVNDARDALHDNKVKGILRLPSNYTTSLSELLTYGVNTNDSDAIIRGFPDLWLDNANFLVLNFMKYDVVRALIEFLRYTAFNCNLNPDTILRTVKIEKPIRGDVEGKHNTYFSVALVVIASFFYPCFTSAATFITEKAGGQVERMLAAGVAPFEIVLVQSCFHLIFTVYQISMMMVVTFVLFQTPLDGSALIMFLLLFITSVSGVMFGSHLVTNVYFVSLLPIEKLITHVQRQIAYVGFFLSLITDSLIATAQLGMAVSLTISMTCGLFGPRESMDDIVKFISDILPITWAVEAVQEITNKGAATFSNEKVCKGFYTAAIWNLIFFALIFYYVRYKRSSFVKKS